MNIASHTITRDYLHPAMDARALNITQTRLIVNPDTPEPDSVIEHLVVIADGADTRTERRAVYQLAGLVRCLGEHNHAEGAIECAIAHAADALAADLRHAERNRPSVASALGVHAIARALRGPLRTIADPAGADPLAFVSAVRSIDRVLAMAPRAQVLTPAVAHELGAGPYGLLERLVSG